MIAKRSGGSSKPRIKRLSSRSGAEAAVESETAQIARPLILSLEALIPSRAGASFSQTTGGAGVHRDVIKVHNFINSSNKHPSPT